jgi:hypothetical protein
MADTETGQHGNYLFRDDQVKTGATCVYAAQGGKYKLTQIVVKGPWLWWPDTNSDNNREHGKVGWNVDVQISKPGSYGPWHTLFESGTQIKTAYEDQPAYDKADSPRMPKLTLYINGAYRKKPNAAARIVHEATWGTGSSTLGSLTHEQIYYNVNGVPGLDQITTACPIHLMPL